MYEDKLNEEHVVVERMCSENEACGNSGHDPNFNKINYSSISTVTATSTLVAVAAVPEVSTKMSNETTTESAAKVIVKLHLPLSLNLPLPYHCRFYEADIRRRSFFISIMCCHCYFNCHCN
jgi:hypothetical protein